MNKSQQPQLKPNAKIKKSKSFTNKENSADLSNPFQTSLNITSKQSFQLGQISPVDDNITITNNPIKQRSRSQSESDEDDDLRKPLSFNSPTINIKHKSTFNSSPHPSPPPQQPPPKPNQTGSTKSNSSSSSIINTPKMSHRKTKQSINRGKPSNSITNTNTNNNTNTNSNNNSNSVTISPTPSLCGSVLNSPGVINSRKNIPSPQRIPCISLRSFHTINHVEFYKPIPISQSRSTQFQIINETYDHKSIQIKKKNAFNSQYPSCITISPTAIDLKRYDSCLITVTCRPTTAMRIKETVRIEWDLHSIEVQIHACGFEKSTRNKNNGKHRERGNRKRSLSNMRKEDNDKCKSVESSLESSRSSSNNSSQQNRYFSLFFFVMIYVSQKRIIFVTF